MINAGHNGLRDIIRHCDNNFMRVRFGVGHPGNKTEVTNYVLKCRAKDKKINVKKLNHKAELIIKYSDKLRKFETQPTLR